MKKRTLFTNKIILSMAIFSAFSTMAVGCGQVADEPMIIVEDSDDSIAYSFITVTVDNVELTTNIRCTYKKNEEQKVYFPVSGKLVDKVYVKKGDTVKAGDVLAELSTGTLEQEIARLEYQIARNELLLGYIDDEESLDMQSYWINYMYYSGMTEYDKERLDANLDSLYKRNDDKEESYNDSLEFDRLKLASLKAELAQSRVYATFDGTVYSIADALEGSTSKVDEVVMTIVDNSEGYFECSDSKYAQYFKEGETVPMSIGYGSGAGDYELMPEEMDTWGDTLKFIVFSGNGEGSIDAGSSGTITLTLEKRENVLTLPSTCVHQADDEYYVYILNENQMREVKWVEIGLVGDSKTEIVSGLSEGEKVIKR